MSTRFISLSPHSLHFLQPVFAHRSPPSTSSTQHKLPGCDFSPLPPPHHLILFSFQVFNFSIDYGSYRAPSAPDGTSSRMNMFMLEVTQHILFQLSKAQHWIVGWSLRHLGNPDAYLFPRPDISRGDWSGGRQVESGLTPWDRCGCRVALQTPGHLALL